MNRTIAWMSAALALATSAAWADPAPGDTSLTLGQAQQEALDHSPLYLLAQAKDAEENWAKVAAGAAFMPRVDLQATHFSNVKFLTLPFNGQAFPEAFPYSDLALNGEWTLFEGFAGLSRLRTADLGAKAADLEQDWALFSLKQDVRLKYYQAITARKLAGLADENVKTLEDHLRIVQDLLDNGQATRFDVLRVEVQLSEARTERLSAQDKVVLARRKLTQAMGIELDERGLSGDLPVPGSITPPAATYLDKQADLRAKALQAEAAESGHRAAVGAWAPKVSLVGGYQWYNNVQMDVNDLNDYHTAYQLGLELDWNLFSGGASLADERQAGAKAEQARQASRQARQQAEYDRDLWSRRLAYSAELYQAKLDDVDKSKESVRLATLGQQAGTRTTTEVLDAELDSFRASAGAVSAQMDAAEALINLELALGQGDLP
ncbi:MAG TPA: TolC family protein [bacterium]|nr:TolC family protein [bacterium]